MDSKRVSDQKVDVNFESHPPIEEDLDGIANLLRQTLLQYADCNSLAQYLIGLKDVTQVIALEGEDEENTSDEDEPDDDIYGVSSVIDLTPDKSGDSSHSEARKQLLKFLKDRCPEVKTLESNSKHNSETKVKLGMIINERYINLPPQLSLPFLKNLTQHLDEQRYTHLVFVAKILLRSRNSDTKLPSKKTKTSEPSGSGKEQEPESIIYVNAEEEIISENAKHHADLDVSSQCDENATWSFSSDIKYIPHRRVMIIDYEKWPTILKSLEKELGQQ